MKNKVRIKIYKKAPLPFQGQKRAFLNKFIELIEDLPDSSVVVDLFGGSGLLAHTVKRTKPNARVIYNDYDNYCKRLRNVTGTNLLLRKIREKVCDIPSEKALPCSLKSEVIEIIQKYEQKHGYVDYMTISSSLLFSMKYANDINELKKHRPFYNKVVSTEYVAAGYLDGLEIERDDYKVIFEKYKEKSNVIFLLDPPYLSTNVSSYKDVDKYWKLENYLEILDLLADVKYVYFSSEKSSIIELFRWMKNKYPMIKNPFSGGTIERRTNAMQQGKKYEDIMVSNLRQS